jgi:hypothetical protein
LEFELADVLFEPVAPVPPVVVDVPWLFEVELVPA